jgi:isoleucyl-tRNA synthetase
MSRPYVTYHNSYIETLWYLLKDIYKKGWLYKGYSIQPYSPQPVRIEHPRTESPGATKT